MKLYNYMILIWVFSGFFLSTILTFIAMKKNVQIETINRVNIIIKYLNYISGLVLILIIAKALHYVFPAIF